MAAVGLPCETFYIIAAETDEPHAVMVYKLEDRAIARGRSLMLEALAEYAACKLTGVWPSYDESTYEIAHPDWA
jgi:hypothetical protein